MALAHQVDAGQLTGHAATEIDALKLVMGRCDHRGHVGGGREPFRWRRPTRPTRRSCHGSIPDGLTSEPSWQRSLGMQPRLSCSKFFKFRLPSTAAAKIEFWVYLLDVYVGQEWRMPINNPVSPA